MWPDLQKIKSDHRALSPISIPVSHIEKGIAGDMGWQNQLATKVGSLILGMEDVLATERDIVRLERAKNLKLDERDLLGAVPLEKQRQSLGAGWYWRMPQLLQVTWPMVRLSEPVQWIYELAREKGYLDERGRMLPAAHIWLQPTSDGIQQAQAFLQELKALSSRRAYRESLRRRDEQAEHNLERHLLLLDYCLVKHGRFRAIALDFFLDRGSALMDIHPGYILENVIQCRGYFFSSIRFSPFFREDGISYLWHLSFHHQWGYYFRAIFFVAVDGLGAHEMFHARASRLWADVTNGHGVCTDCRKHPNELARVGWMVDANNEKSVKKIEKALVYQIEKDKRFRIVTPEKLHVFGHTEMSGLESSMLENAWARLHSASSSMEPALWASHQRRLQSLHLALMKRAELKSRERPFDGAYMGVAHHVF